MRNALILGGIIGGISIIQSLIMRFAMDSTLIFSGKQIVFSTLLTFIILFVGGRKLLRDPEKGELSYGEAVKGLYIALMFSSILILPSTILLFGNDHQLKEAHSDMQERSTEATLSLGMKAAGLSDVEIESEIERIKAENIKTGVQEPPYPFSWSMAPFNIAMSGVMYLFIALLGALGVREKS